MLRAPVSCTAVLSQLTHIQGTDLAWATSTTSNTSNTTASITSITSTSSLSFSYKTKAGFTIQLIMDWQYSSVVNTSGLGVINIYINCLDQYLHL